MHGLPARVLNSHPPVSLHKINNLWDSKAYCDCQTTQWTITTFRRIPLFDTNDIAVLINATHLNGTFFGAMQAPL